MKITQIGYYIISLGLLSFTGISFAEVSAEVAVVSDYRDNGVSNSDRKPALQVELAYEHDSGLYASGWASNVDYGKDEDGESYPERVELELALGYGFDVNADLSLDFGVASYSYIGKTDSSDSNYQELYVGANFFGNTDFYTYYAPDYFNSDARNFIFSLSHEIELNDYVLGLKAVHYQSGNKERLEWRENKADYQDFEVSIARDWQGFNVGLAAIVTTITDGENEDAAKPTAVLSVSKAWSW